MMKVKVAEVGDGLHPSEVVVSIQTIEGQQNIVVDKRSLSAGNTLRVGYPIRRQDDKYLIELPRETVNGSWRVWVNKSEIEDHERQSAA